MSRRVFRCVERIARLQHRCDRCNHVILPGDYYEVMIVLIGSGKHSFVRNEREHINPPCEFDPTPSDDEWISIGNSVEFKMAA